MPLKMWNKSHEPMRERRAVNVFVWYTLVPTCFSQGRWFSRLGLFPPGFSALEQTSCWEEGWVDRKVRDEERLETPGSLITCKLSGLLGMSPSCFSCPLDFKHSELDPVRMWLGNGTGPSSGQTPCTVQPAHVGTEARGTRSIETPPITSAAQAPRD